MPGKFKGLRLVLQVNHNITMHVRLPLFCSLEHVLGFGRYIRMARPRFFFLALAI